MTPSSVLKGGFAGAVGYSDKVRLAIVVLFLTTFVAPVILSYFDYSLVQLVLAMVLLDVCLYPTLRYFARHETGTPVLPVLCISFAVQYAVPILTREPGIDLGGGGVRYVSDADIQSALALSIMAVCLLQVTYFWVMRSLRASKIPNVRIPLAKKKAEIYCIAAFAASLIVDRVPQFLPQDTYLQFSAIANLLHNQLYVAIGVLGWVVFTGQGRKWQRFLLYAVVAVTALKGFSTTMMEQMFLPVAVLVMTKWLYTRRMPVLMLTLLALTFVLLSPVKADIREVDSISLQPRAEVATTDRVTDWVSRSIEYWTDTLRGRRDFAESTSTATGRTDLIHPFAHIHSLTPSVVPYQYGNTYSYLAIGWIPRAIWPEKPIANFANNYYAVAYEISTEEGVERSTFGVSIIGEGYVNFGVAGVVMIIVVLGLTLALLEHVFGHRNAGAGGYAIFLVTFLCFLGGIGTSTEMMFGGLVQNIIASCLLLWWVREKRSTTPVRVPVIKREPTLDRIVV